MWKDRASKDFWCVQCRTYLGDIVGYAKIPIVANTTGSGHGKDYLDQIGGTTHSHMNRATGNKTLKILANKSKAKQLASYCNDTFNESKTRSIKRHCRTMPCDQICTKVSS